MDEARLRGARVQAVLAWDLPGAFGIELGGWVGIPALILPMMILLAIWQHLVLTAVPPPAERFAMDRN